MLSYSDAVKYRPSSPPPRMIISRFLERKAFHIKETNDLFRKMKNYNGTGFLTVVRQFSCKNCMKCWWKRVRSIKQVSRCKGCNVKYDPIPINIEFGCGIFFCRCSNRFTGRIQMGHKKACHKCKRECFPKYIIKKKDEIPRRFHSSPPLSRPPLPLPPFISQHRCEKCVGVFYCPTFRRILAFSEVHQTTGSTQASLPNQINLEERFINDFEELGSTSFLEISTDADEDSFS